MSSAVHAECRKLLGSLSEYIDGELRPELCRELEKHLAECENCRIVLNTTRRTIDLVRLPPGPQPAMPEAVRERLFKRLHLDDYLKPGRS